MSFSEKPDLFGSPVRIEIETNGAVLLFTSFEAAAFTPDLFARTGVALPVQLSKAVPKRQVEFLVGRLLANRAIETLGFPAAPLPIGSDRAPIWPHNLHGAISHSDNYCAVLVTRNTGQTAGVDVEGALTKNAIRSILRIVLNEAEAGVMDTSSLPPELAAAAAFSAKETIFKALFPHVSAFFGFDAARLQNLTETGLTFCLADDINPRLPKGTCIDVNLHVTEGHVLTWLLYDG